MTTRPAPRRRLLRAVVALALLGPVSAGVHAGGPAAADPAPTGLSAGLVAQYLFEEDGAVAHNTADGSAAAGDPLDAYVRNFTPAQRSERGSLLFTGGAKTSTGNWVELPDDILAGAQSATISVDVRADATMLRTNHYLWNIGDETTAQYWFANVRQPRSAITTSSAAGERNATGYAITAGRWHSLTAVIDASQETITYYTDGQRAGVAKTRLTPADLRQTANTIGRSPWPDALFRGAVGAFHVYDRALSDSEVVSLSDLDGRHHAAELRAASDAKLAALDLGDTGAVTSDLELVTIKDVSWSSSEPDVVAADGTVVRPSPGSGDATVVLRATATTRGQQATAPRAFVVRVPALTAADLVADRDALTLPDVVRGNVTLPARGAAGAPVTWRSSDDDVIATRPVGAAAPGVVDRPEWGQPDVTVTLTATVGTGDQALTRDFRVRVAALPRPAVDNRYMFGYFTGDTLAGENIYLAASQGNTAMKWDVLNEGRPVLTSTEGTRGLRDPFIMRSAEGDRFFLIATDLSIGSGTSWDQALDNGSAHLEIWESTDLRTWSQQRHVKVSGPNASMTWAPEAYWDEARGEYVLYWSSRMFLDSTRPYDKAGTPNWTYSKVMYATTRDFVTFSKARVWQDAGDRIDSTMIEDDGTFYRFTKEVTGCTDILQESSPTMLAPTVPGDYAWRTDASCVSKTARGTTRTTEGPTIFRANVGDTSLPTGVDRGYYLFVDDFTGAGYLPLFSETLADPTWRTVAGSLPSSRHGSVMPVTLNQWESARGLEPTTVGTDTTLDVADGDTLRAGDVVTARIVADDGGPVAGEVVLRFGKRTVIAQVRRDGDDYVAVAAVPRTTPPAKEVAVSATYEGLDVLTSSADEVTVTVAPGRARPPAASGRS